MKICSKSKDGRHNFATPGADCFNGCGVNQSVLSGRQTNLNDKNNINNLLNKWHNDFKVSQVGKARNYMEEIAWNYLTKFNWTNDTFFNDYKFFWIACNVFWSSHLPFEFENIMRWGASKNVHPRGIANLLKRGKPKQNQYQYR